MSDANYYLSYNPGWPIYNPSWTITTPPTGTLFNTAITYDKGACVLHMLRYTLGDSLFFAVLKAYATDAVNFKFGNVVTSDFIVKVNEIVGQDMTWFFTWVYQPNHPVYGNTYNITSLAGDQWQVGFKARQTQTNADFFPMPLTLRISFSSGPDTTLRMMNNINEQVFAFRFGRQPTSLTFDPNSDIVIKQGNTAVGPTLSAPALLLPVPNATEQPVTLSLLWSRAISAATYRLQVGTDSSFASVVVDDSTIADTMRQAGPLLPNTQYFWRVCGRNSAGSGPFSSIRGFRTLTSHANTYAYAEGWNLVSVPLLVTDRRTATLFPPAVSNAYGYDPARGYLREDTLQNGLGYWLKFDGPQNIPIDGLACTLDTVDLVGGWNLVGAISNPVGVTSIEQIPPGVFATPFYGYGSTYGVVDTLRAGKGYWVKALTAGRMVLSSSTQRLLRSSGKGVGR